MDLRPHLVHDGGGAVGRVVLRPLQLVAVHLAADYKAVGLGRKGVWGNRGPTINSANKEVKIIEC